MSLGATISEDEARQLEKYFVNTNQWQRILAGDVDIVYGPKGSGKSAIYAMLNNKKLELFDRNILIILAENPRGTPAFKDLVADPPTTEEQFRALWKTYFLMLIGNLFKEEGIKNDEALKLVKYLEDEKLIPRDQSLSAYIKIAMDFVKRLTTPEALETEVGLNPITGTPESFKGRIILKEPSAKQSEDGIVSIDKLVSIANLALEKEKFFAWILLDRLDVAFTENVLLEENALRALFKVYLDLAAFDHIKIKVFLRTDIWNRITKGGFREASHITRHVTISWDLQSLLNLIIRRILQNESLNKYYEIKPEEILSDAGKQRELFYRIYPKKVDVGDKKPETFIWMLSRTVDGIRKNAPRELIQLLSFAKDSQLRKLEMGEGDPEGEALFVNTSIKDGLKEVSKVRLTQTLFAEYPEVREFLLKLKNQKTQQNIKALSEIWNLEYSETEKIVEELIEIGFFEKRTSKEGETSYWVPFLYRDELDMVQGAAETSEDQ